MKHSANTDFAEREAQNIDKAIDSHHIGTLPHIPCRWRHCDKVCFHSGPLGFRNSFQCSQQDIYNNGYSQCWHSDHHGDIAHPSGALMILEKCFFKLVSKNTNAEFKSHHVNNIKIPLWRAAVSQETLEMSQ